MERRTFSKQFKEQAVARLRAGASVADVALHCQVHPKILRRWRTEVDRFGDQAFSGYGKSRASLPSKVGSVLFRLTQEEYACLESQWRSSTARTLSDYARERVLNSPTDPSHQALEQKLEQLIAAVQRLSYP